MIWLASLKISHLIAFLSIPVTSKVVAQTVPAIGDVVSALFYFLYQDIGTSHFQARRLEQQYGGNMIRMAFEQIALERRTLLLAGSLLALMATQTAATVSRPIAPKPRFDP